MNNVATCKRCGSNYNTETINECPACNYRPEQYAQDAKVMAKEKNFYSATKDRKVKPLDMQS
jgi:ribosomal protein L37E